MITIRQNEALDEEMYMAFHDFSVAGVDFGAEIRETHANITVTNHKKYIKDYYRDHQAEITKMVEDTQKNLDIKSGDFFSALKDYFGKDYSDKDYVGFASIFNCNPRFVESGTFQVFYLKKPAYRIEVCFHEVAHFVFFDFCKKQVSCTHGLDTNSGPLWELSEIVNVILLNQPKFQKLIGIEESLFYSTLKSKLEGVRAIWEKNGQKMNASFICESLEYLKKSPSPQRI
jgi:hypothetical protein